MEFGDIRLPERFWAKCDLSDADVQSIRTSPLTQADLARAYGIHPSHVSKILSGTKWRESA